MAGIKQKSIWKSKSFITGIIMMVTAMAASFGIDIPEDVLNDVYKYVLEGGAIFLMGKSVTKRM